MFIALEKDQVLLGETAYSFAQNALSKDRIRSLELGDEGFDMAIWKEMARLGWAATIIPERYGGSGAGWLELGLILEALGRAALPSPIFSTGIEATFLLLEASSDAQKMVLLPQIASGDAILTAALLESSGELNLSDLHTTIKPHRNGFLIQGSKVLVRDAATAKAMICVAQSGERPDDLTLVLVPSNAPGLKATRMPAAGGEPLWRIDFEGVKIDADAVIGEMGHAGPAIARLYLRGAAMKAAELVGIGQAALDLTLNYAKTRIQFGKPIGSFQSVQHHCTDMYRDLQVSRLLVWQACASLGRGMAGQREVAIAKAKTSACMPALTRMAHQVHGAVAYYRDYPLELYHSRALAAQAAYGNAAQHRRRVAALLYPGGNRVDAVSNAAGAMQQPPTDIP